MNPSSIKPLLDSAVSFLAALSGATTLGMIGFKDRASALVLDGSEAVLWALAGVAVAAMVIPAWRAERLYIFAGLITGTVVGIAVVRFGFHPGWQVAAPFIAAITAPATVMSLHGKTLSEAISGAIRAIRGQDGPKG